MFRLLHNHIDFVPHHGLADVLGAAACLFPSVLVCCSMFISQCVGVVQLDFPRYVCAAV